MKKTGSKSLKKKGDTIKALTMRMDLDISKLETSRGDMMEILGQKGMMESSSKTIDLFFIFLWAYVEYAPHSYFQTISGT